VYHSVNLDSLVCVHDDGDEDAQDDVDEETDEEVEVDATVPPHDTVDVIHRRECREDVVTVDQTEETLGRRRHLTKLYNNHYCSVIESRQVTASSPARIFCIHSCTCTCTRTHTHTVLTAIFPVKPGLAGWPLNSPPFILELCIILGQPKLSMSFLI